MLSVGRITVTRALEEAPGLYYSYFDTDGDGEIDDVVLIPKAKFGDYLVTVIPQDGAQPGDTFSLDVMMGGTVWHLARDVRIADIPSEPYVFSVVPEPASMFVMAIGTVALLMRRRHS